MRYAGLVIMVLIGAAIVASAIVLRPTGFDRCLKIISGDIERHNPSATYDPRDLEAQAARICSGVARADIR